MLLICRFYFINFCINFIHYFYKVKLSLIVLWHWNIHLLILCFLVILLLMMGNIRIDLFRLNLWLAHGLIDSWLAPRNIRFYLIKARGNHLCNSTGFLLSILLSLGLLLVPLINLFSVSLIMILICLLSYFLLINLIILLLIIHRGIYLLLLYMCLPIPTKSVYIMRYFKKLTHFLIWKKLFAHGYVPLLIHSLVNYHCRLSLDVQHILDDITPRL